MKLIPHVGLKVPMCGRSFESTLFSASHDVDVIRPDEKCLKIITTSSTKLFSYLMVYILLQVSAIIARSSSDGTAYHIDILLSLGPSSYIYNCIWE
jgi:hypothetical protein